jgi:hypothetical protein
MSHEMLESGQRDAGAHHIGSEGVPKPMRVGLADLATGAMMAEQRTESGRGHGLSAMAAFQADQQRTRVGERPFQPQIVFQDVDDFLGQGQDALLVSLTEDPHLRVGQFEILELEGEDFTGPEAIE